MTCLKPKTYWKYLVIGTKTGAVIIATCEGDARRAFHTYFGGQSIHSVSSRGQIVASRHECRN